MLLKTHGQESTQLPNSSILSNNHELRGIVVNKGQIHRELGYLLIIFLNLIKSDDEIWMESTQFDIFGKNTQR